ncbi:NB-ARC domain-containing protein [Amycolatopsis sp. cg5]|uniref:NB-ARC domain-containing protein n=1 Tax=Amycolatopsis sp. cg5 TaxID=3238802 RepID=UPI003526A3B8
MTVHSVSTRALPPLSVALTGREREQEILVEFLVEVGESALLPVMLVHGPPGAGKTALAVDAGQRLGGLFADGCMFLDLRGEDDEPVSADQAARRLLRGFEVEERQIPADSEDVMALYRSQLAGRAVLLILDNASSEAQVRPLLATSPGTMVLVTSRNTLVGLPVRTRLALDLLDLEDSLALLRAAVGDQLVDAEPEAAARVGRLCGGVPLALLIAGTRIAGRPQWTLEYFACQLEDQRRRLSVLTAGDLQVRAAFELSYRLLAPDSALMFRRLALVPGASASVELAAVVSGLEEPDAENALEELADASLLAAGGPGRYSRHDLLNLFAAECLEREDDPARVREADERTRHWLLDVAARAGQFFDHDRTEPPDRVDGPDPVSDRESAGRWLLGELEQWRGALRAAARHREHDRVATVVAELYWYSDLRGDGELWSEVFRAGADAAGELGDTAREAVLLNALSWALYRLCGRDADALAVFERAAVKAAQADDLLTRGWNACYGSAIHARLGDIAEAVSLARVAVELFEHGGYPMWRFIALAKLGVLLQQQGRDDEAVALHRLCVTYYRTLPATPDNEELLALVLQGYAECLLAAGDLSQAFTMLDEAESLFLKHQATELLADVWRLRGEALNRAGRWPEAIEQLRAAADSAMIVETRVQAIACLAEVAQRTGDEDLAREQRTRALAECAAFDTPALRAVAAKLTADATP